MYEFSFLDIETTGLLKEGQEIIEICIKKYTYELKTKQSNFITEKVWRIKPKKNIEAKAMAVHGITMESLKKEPLKDKVFPEVLDFVAATDLFIAHNGDEFDRPFLDMDMATIGLKMPNKKWFDTMLDCRWATPWGKVPNLGELAFACQQDYDTTKAHSASYDVRVMANSFFYALERNIIDIEPYLH